LRLEGAGMTRAGCGPPVQAIKMKKGRSAMSDETEDASVEKNAAKNEPPPRNNATN
jgi:hypothetical protein